MSTKNIRSPYNFSSEYTCGQFALQGFRCIELLLHRNDVMNKKARTTFIIFSIRVLTKRDSTHYFANCSQEHVLSNNITSAIFLLVIILYIQCFY